MNIENRVNSLVKLGQEFKDICQKPEMHNFPGYEIIYNNNLWFIEEFVKYSLQHWADILTQKNIIAWIGNYNIEDKVYDKRVGIIMAGNIPLVGLHDLICAFICGVKINIKPSSKDLILTKWVVDRIIQISDCPADHIIISENRLSDFDAIIATGSNNSNRYFEYYFSSYPNILRKNRNSAAILNGNEKIEELQNLADDIFLYFGLGCRSVSKIYIPKDYNFDLMIEAFKKWTHLSNYSKYINNYEYQFAIMIMNQIKHIDFKNLLMTESPNLYSPVAVVNYQYYDDYEILIKNLYLQKDDIQCIVGDINNEGINALGSSQKPQLGEYADEIDTIKFILNLTK